MVEWALLLQIFNLKKYGNQLIMMEMLSFLLKILKLSWKQFQIIPDSLTNVVDLYSQTKQAVPTENFIH
jgi:hypothetical protein